MHALPFIPPRYSGPNVASLDSGKNMKLVPNEAHIKATNNGYSRNSMGGFFSH